MKGTIIGIGGGVKIKPPSILAFYPTGSTCTCSNGTETYVAKDNSGFWRFDVRALGDWTVTITDGSKEAYQTVSLTDATQIKRVELFYPLEILTTAGVLAEGYSVTGKRVNPAIDVTKYTKMTFTAKVTWAAASGYGCYVGLSTSATSTADGAFLAEVNVTSTSRKTYTLSLANLKGELYIRSYYAMSFSDGTIGTEGSGASISIDSITFS